MDNFKLLQKIREQQLTQRELADNCGICASTISEIIKRRRNPTEAQKELIADALSVSVKSIFSKN